VRLFDKRPVTGTAAVQHPEKGTEAPKIAGVEITQKNGRSLQTNAEFPVRSGGNKIGIRESAKLDARHAFGPFVIDWKKNINVKKRVMHSAGRRMFLFEQQNKKRYKYCLDVYKKKKKRR